MVFSFTRTLLFAAALTIVKSDPYFPCKSYISFSYDDSGTLSSNEFRTQMNFIKNVIGKINYPNRLRTEGAFTGEFNWNSGLSITQMQSAIGNAIQTSNQYSLLQQAASLLTSVEVLDSINDPIAALIFISDTSDSALRNADRWFAKLGNVEITFILLGPNVNSLKLRQFSKNFIYWPDLTEPEPDNWDLLSYNAFGCNVPSSSTTPQQLSTLSTSPLSSSTATSISPITRTTTTTTTPSVPYIPCQSWIHFGIDDSNFLSDDAFYTQLNFISNAIGNITHPERIAAAGEYSQPVPWNSGLSIPQIQDSIKGMSQAGPYLLRNQFALLLTYLEDIQINDIPVGALIFITDTSDAALAGADQYFNQIQNVRITFVLLGDRPDQSKLTKYSNNFISWLDLFQPQPNNWNNLNGPAYGCIQL